RFVTLAEVRAPRRERLALARQGERVQCVAWHLETADLRRGANVPEPNRAVVTRGAHLVAIRCEDEGRDALTVAAQCALLRAGRVVEQMYQLVLAADGQRPAVAREGQRQDAAIQFEAIQFHAGGGLPDADRWVGDISSRGDRVSVRSERDTVDGTSMS